MKTAEAIKIIQTLALGVNPHTGKTLPDESPYRDIKTVIALNTAMEALEKIECIETRRNNAPKNSGKIWKPKEDRKLVTAYESGASTKKIAEQHQRTEIAINGRLVKLGIIEYDKSNSTYIRKK